MQMYYSPSKGGFYCREVHGDNMPEDVRMIPGQLYAQLRGQDVIAGPDGMPMLRPPPDPAVALEELHDQARADTRIQRAPIINTLASLQVSALMLGNTAEAQAIEVCKLALLDLTKVDLSACTDYEQCRLAVKARYMQIAAGAPASVRLAFKEALA